MTAAGHGVVCVNGVHACHDCYINSRTQLERVCDFAKAGLKTILASRRRVLGGTSASEMLCAFDIPHTSADHHKRPSQESALFRNWQTNVDLTSVLIQVQDLNDLQFTK